MGSNTESCDLRRQLVFSYHLITKFPCHLWEATQANVSSHLIMKRKNRQNVLEKQTALITPHMLLENLEEEHCACELFIRRRWTFLKTRMNALVILACPGGSGNRCVRKARENLVQKKKKRPVKEINVRYGL